MLYYCERKGNHLVQRLFLNRCWTVLSELLTFFLKKLVQLQSEHALQSSHNIHKHQESISNFVV